MRLLVRLPGRKEASLYCLLLLLFVPLIATRHYRLYPSSIIPSISPTTKEVVVLQNNHKSSGYNNHHAVFAQANHTLVTAYYELETERHPPDWYRRTLRMLFSNDDAMIVFTSPDLVANLTRMRARFSDKTVVLPFELEKMRAARFNVTTTTDGWNKAMRTEHRVGWVWNEKVEFLKKAVRWNPFDSNFFAWYDAGMARFEEYTNTTLIQRIPPELKRDELMIMNCTRITWKQQNVMMSAGIFGGYKEGILRYHRAYYKYLKKQVYLGNHKVLLEEQHPMYQTCLQNEGMCFSVRPARSRRHGEALQFPMFYMLAFLNQRRFDEMKRDDLVQADFGPYSPP